METVPKITEKLSYAESAFKLLGDKVVVNESTPFIDGIFWVFWSTALEHMEELKEQECVASSGAPLSKQSTTDRGNILS